jgi:hypothetical protein
MLIEAASISTVGKAFLISWMLLKVASKKKILFHMTCFLITFFFLPSDELVPVNSTPKLDLQSDKKKGSHICWAFATSLSIHPSEFAAPNFSVTSSASRNSSPA